MQKSFPALMSLLLLAMGLSMSTLSGCYYDNEEDLYPVLPDGGNTCDTLDVSYADAVLPILEGSCISCHRGANPSGNVSLDSYDAVVQNAESGELYGSMAHLNGFSKMPKGGNQLPDCDLAQVKSWIDAGTPNN